jgi:hypothetical protein
VGKAEMDRIRDIGRQMDAQLVNSLSRESSNSEASATRMTNINGRPARLSFPKSLLVNIVPTLPGRRRIIC